MASTGGGLPMISNTGDCFAHRVAQAFNDKSIDLNNDGISAEEAYNCGRESWLNTPYIYSFSLR